LIRHYGVFASRSKLRPLLPPPPARPLETPTPAASKDVIDEDHDRDDLADDHHHHHGLKQDRDEAPPPHERTYRLPWARLMKLAPWDLIR